MKRVSFKINIPIRYRQASILVVEDSDDEWFVIRWAFLQNWPGVKVVRTTNMTDTMTYLASCFEKNHGLPDLILLDLYLPDREDGWALLESIKVDCFYRRVPVVMISNSTLQEDIEQSYYLHSNSYIVKPTTYQGWGKTIKEFRHYWTKSVALPEATL
ncbi:MULTISPECIES: response regulator [Spirosoma]|uniref:Response regulator n=1 Tax=Spirosoma liriopis TaxID=2937440 RepID=A0ABT0HDP5_9BACT|nr:MULTISPECIES: response regulator [Spirosoma]MCK8490269.1 response regulator [Spirosoma liriopis]UHG89644.1 response regulator [Spirosoma oryzicola]